MSGRAQRAGIRTDELGSYWYLEGFVDSDREMWRTLIRGLPLQVGRGNGCDLLLLSGRVSGSHAELFSFDGSLWLRDLDSRNGTFVNFERLREPRRLEAGDTVHFADMQFRVGVHRAVEVDGRATTSSLCGEQLANFLLGSSEGMAKLLAERSIRSLAQPVRELATGLEIGAELLSRGDLEGFESSPAELFSIAEFMGRERELSELCRALGTERARRDGAVGGVLFLNTHPSELRAPDQLVDSLASLRRSHPRASLVLEIHESAVTRPATIRELQRGLRPLGVGIAFDDFGVGQSRIMELAEVPPDYLKFDMGFVRRLDQRTGQRRAILERLVGTARDFGAVPVAEGIETEAERQACLDIGFECGQGFHLGVPAPI